MFFINLSLIIVFTNRKDRASLDTYNLLLDICLLLCSIKGIRLYKETVHCGYPVENSILCPRGLSLKDHPCSGNYCQEICPRLLFLSAVMMVCGIINIIAGLILSNYSRMIISISICFLLLIIIWFGISLSKAQKKYFRF